jgi:2'-5' RNA ligase
MSTVRLFIGVWLAPSMTEEVQNFIASIKKNYPGYKWTNSENLHFTLKFLGEVSREKLPALQDSLKSATHQASFSVRLGPVGYFPSANRPRIIWLGLKTGQTQLVTLASSVETFCFKTGFAKSDKPFQPHLTIARAKDDILPPKLTDETPIFETETLVSGFSLIESQLFPTGSVYKVVKDFTLKEI